MARRYQEPVTGERALVGLEGFMKGWQFGSSIMREDEDKKDREQKRKDEADDRAWKGEERGRERIGWTQADEDREYTVATRETPEEIKGRRKTAAELQAESLTAAQRGNRQAPTDAEATEERTLGLEGKRIGNKNAKDANARAWRQDAREAKKDAEKDSGGKVLAALDYFQRNQALLDPKAMSAVERLYTALSVGDMKKAQRGDVDMAANVFKKLLDKRTEWKGMPIVDSRAKTLFKDGKVVLEMSYKVRQPDGSVVDVDAGPVSKASEDGTDVVYELDDADAMKLLAAHTLIGRDIKKMADAGYANPMEAIDELRRQYIESQGGSGVDELKKIDPKAVKGGLNQEKLKFGDQEVVVQFDKEVGISDDTPIVGGMLTDDSGKPIPARTVGEAKQALGLAPPPAASGGDAPVTVSTQAQVAALPKGAKFIFNGKEYTKK